MLFAKSALVLSFLALGNIAAAASTKACLLSALAQEPKPGDLKAVCVTNGEKVQSKIASLCGDDKEEALKQFADTCSSAGHKVVVNTSTSSGAASTGTPSAGSKSSSSGFITATPTSTSGSHSGSGSSSSARVIPTSGSGSGANSGSGSSASPSSSTSAAVPLHTANAGSSDKHIPAAAFAAVVFVGFAATL
ncbi:hypothetical protein ETB97_002320 [Aspergillus alliaceus]|uniref:GPI anchored cell wall protein n=1 Tax=Petromyces alliaceus TaxID=209559 RepID=A0A5N6GD14_PETAA|nr:uncharacterized protein BDW43DRAFT_305623 [Aspergillus alliaceus]KAB8239868.1 hypothetical protein BDW43DRAFT_305623 [Aspergillus alliaceus]KAE8390600.1 hypothetical protein BDV23DRAFT_154902 [Aspergillus alliaceus]KAF5865807.1 hypothetical protein ETB97_002320 [Aspergillus burnettii]